MKVKPVSVPDIADEGLDRRAVQARQVLRAAKFAGPFGVLMARPPDIRLPLAGSRRKTYLPKNERSPAAVLVPANFAKFPVTVVLADTVLIGNRTPNEPSPPLNVFSKPKTSR